MVPLLASPQVAEMLAAGLLTKTNPLDVLQIPASVGQLASRFIESRRANKDMLRHGYILGDTDDYWHRLAIAEQAQKSPMLGSVALFIGHLNEAKDLIRDMGNGMSLKDAGERGRKDLQRNENGFNIGSSYIGDLLRALEPYKNKSLKDWEQKYKKQ